MLVSGRGSNMAALARDLAAPGAPATIAAVIASRPDAPALSLAAALGLHAEALDARAFATREAFDEALAARIEAVGAHWVVCAGYMRLLSEAFVARFAGRILNVHPSLLPAFPGLDTHARALAAGVRWHGATVHFVTPRLDHGPIVSQGVVPVLDDDDPATLAERVLAIEHRLLPAAVRWAAQGRLRLAGERVFVVDSQGGESQSMRDGDGAQGDATQAG